MTNLLHQLGERQLPLRLFSFLSDQDCTSLRLASLRFDRAFRVFCLLSPSQWQTKLPLEVVEQILDVLQPADFYTAGNCVCRSWRSASRLTSLIVSQLKRLHRYSVGESVETMWMRFLLAVPRRYATDARHYRVSTLNFRPIVAPYAASLGFVPRIFLADFGEMIAIALTTTIGFYSFLRQNGRFIDPHRRVLAYPKGLGVTNLDCICIAHAPSRPSEDVEPTIVVVAVFRGGRLFRSTLSPEGSFSRFVRMGGGLIWRPSDTNLSNNVETRNISPLFLSKSPEGFLHLQMTNGSTDVRFISKRGAMMTGLPQTWDTVQHKMGNQAGADPDSSPTELHRFLKWSLASRSPRYWPVDGLGTLLTQLCVTPEGLHLRLCFAFRSLSSGPFALTRTGVYLLAPLGVTCTPAHVAALQVHSQLTLIAVYWEESACIYLYEISRFALQSTRVDVHPQRLAMFASSPARISVVSIKFCEQAALLQRAILVVVMAAGFVHICQLSSFPRYQPVDWAESESSKLRDGLYDGCRDGWKKDWTIDSGLLVS